MERCARRYALAGAAVIALTLGACSGGGSGAKTATSTPATRASATPSTGTPARLATALSSATVAGSGTPVPAPSATGIRACTPSDVTARASEQGAPGSIGGSMTITNDSPADCTLAPAAGDDVPRLKLKDSAGAPLATSENTLPGSTPEARVTLHPKQGAFVTFVWSNWCTPPPAGPLSIEVAVPGEPGAISTRITGSDAAAIATPRCDAPSQPSILSVGSFTLAGSP